MANFENQLLDTRSYVKSNEMISAKYRSTLLENQVMAIALTRIEENNKDDSNQLEAKLYPGELKRLVSDDAHIYRDLKTLAKSITGHTMFLEDGKGNFKAFSIIPNADYQDGVFTIKFNRVLKEHLLGMERNFATLELSVMTSFTKNSAFRIYELLKKDLFRANPSVNGGCVDVEYNLFEFRFLIGIANSDNIHVQNRIKTMKEIDWEELYHVLEKNGSKSDIKFKTTDKLQKDCLKPAQEELAEKSDLRFEYELERIGRPYKKIIFHIYPNTPGNKQDIERRQKDLESMGGNFRQYEIPRDLNAETQSLYDDYIGHNKLTKEDLDYLVKTAEFHISDVREAIKYVDKQGVVQNYMGYIVKAIQERYFDVPQTSVFEGSAEKAEQLKKISEEYNDEDNKKALLNNLWEQWTQKDVFKEFLEASGLSEEVLNSIPIEKRCTLFTDWRKANNKPLE